MKRAFALLLCVLLLCASLSFTGIAYEVNTHKVEIPSINSAYVITDTKTDIPAVDVYNNEGFACITQFAGDDYTFSVASLDEGVFLGPVSDSFTVSDRVFSNIPPVQAGYMLPADSKTGYFFENGDRLNTKDYTTGMPFGDGVAFVMGTSAANTSAETERADEAFLIDKQGNEVLLFPEYFSWVGMGYENVLYAYLDTASASEGYIPMYSRVIPGDTVFDYSPDYLSDLLWDEFCGYIDREGNVLIPLEYSAVTAFDSGVAAVREYIVETDTYGDGNVGTYRVPGNWGVINKEGEVVVPFEYDYISAFSNGLALATKGFTVYIIDKDGNIISEKTDDGKYGEGFPSDLKGAFYVMRYEAAVVLYDIYGSELWYENPCDISSVSDAANGVLYYTKDGMLCSVTIGWEEYSDTPEEDFSYYKYAVGTMVGDLFDSAEVVSVTDEFLNAMDISMPLATGMIITTTAGNTYPVVVPGDADCDGKITSADARLALRRSVGLESFGEGTPVYQACDVDGGGVSAADARLILRGSVGLENPLEWTAKG